MREHAIPQDVVGYRFHIIGNMTLQQFLEVGAGCLLGFIIYTTNLYNFIKWPLIGLAVAIGALAAFVPFEERPLDHWIVTFFKTLYKPTKFFWRKTANIPAPFLYQPNSDQTNAPTLDLAPAKRQRIKEYLSSLDHKELNQEETAEKTREAQILAAFSEVKIKTEASIIAPGGVRPKLKVHAHGLKNLKTDPSVTIYDSSSTKEVTQITRLAATQKTVVIPANQEVVVAQTTEPAAAATAKAQAEALNASPIITKGLTGLTTADQQAVTNSALPFPTKPDQPNKLVGMVLSRHQDLINEAIVEIQNQDGQVVRAVKTNALGQFFITTPLDNGNYTIFIEKDGFNFEPLSLQLKGEVIDPLQINSL